MSNGYAFEKIDNNNYLKYNGAYAPDGFSFIAYPYFTMIDTNYNNDSYSNACTPNNVVATRFDIYDMLKTESVKVDLIVKGEDTADFILPLVGIDNGYAYFSNGDLSLKIDSNGAVTVG